MFHHSSYLELIIIVDSRHNPNLTLSRPRVNIACTNLIIVGLARFSNDHNFSTTSSFLLANNYFLSISNCHCRAFLRVRRVAAWLLLRSCHIVSWFNLTSRGLLQESGYLRPLIGSFVRHSYIINAGCILLLLLDVLKNHLIAESRRLLRLLNLDVALLHLLLL